MGEAEIMREVLLRLGSRSDCRLWRHNVGVGWVKISTGYRPQQFGVAGQPDLMGCAMVRGVAVWLGVEIKTKSGRQSATQKQWGSVMEAVGGIYLLARSADDAEAQLEQAMVCAAKRMDTQ